MTFGQAPFLCKHRFVAEKPYCRRTPSRAHPPCLSQMFMNEWSAAAGFRLILEPDFNATHYHGTAFLYVYHGTPIRNRTNARTSKSVAIGNRFGPYCTTVLPIDLVPIVPAYNPPSTPPPPHIAYLTKVRAPQGRAFSSNLSGGSMRSSPKGEPIRLFRLI